MEEWRVAGDAGGGAVGVGVAEERVFHVEAGVEEGELSGGVEGGVRDVAAEVEPVAEWLSGIAEELW